MIITPKLYKDDMYTIMTLVNRCYIMTICTPKQHDVKYVPPGYTMTICILKQ